MWAAADSNETLMINYCDYNSLSMLMKRLAQVFIQPLSGTSPLL